MLYKYGLSFFFIFEMFAAFGLQPGDSINRITMPASESYHKSAGYQRRWGKHYREEWHKPVTFNKVNLDTLAGGLTPYKEGGGRQSKSLRLRDKNGREYVLRSIDKSFGRALPDITLGTFMEDIANDQVTFSHPYAALIVAPLAEAAGILHTNPAIFYVPAQTALGKFNKTYGNALYLFEQRADEDWSDAPNFGNSNKIIGTDKLLEKILEENNHVVNQEAFVKARLFDMLIGDWGRHEDQWRWAGFKSNKVTTYLPVPRDRDNAFTKLDGSFLKPIIGLVGANHMQNFDYQIKDINEFNFPARHLDRRFLNALNLQQWLGAAATLQATLTDNIIDKAVKRLPVEVYSISGPAIASKLKSRRQQLQEYATEYFRYLAREVDIPGTQEKEYFQIENLSDSTTRITIYNKEGDSRAGLSAFYERTFNHSQTKEIRLYGIGGNDSFNVTGNIPKGLTVRLVGGPSGDIYSRKSSAKQGFKTVKIYDNKENVFNLPPGARLNLSSDTGTHRYEYEHFKPDKKGVRPAFFFSQADRLYAGLRYKYQKQGWRKSPYAVQHVLEARYSLGQKAPSIIYSGSFPALLGKWEILLYANYDFVVWTNFFGLGNETKRTTDDNDFNRIRNRQLLAKAGAQRTFGNRHRVTFSPFYQTYDVINDTSRYLAKSQDYSTGNTYRTRHFAGAGLEYVYQHTNDSVLPVKGVSFLAAGNYTKNLGGNGKDVSTLSAEANFYLPLIAKFNLYISAGANTLTGDPEFYQYNKVASSQTIRGYRRDRFYGTSTFYNQNELRWISDVRSHRYNGKIGLFALYDIGRVWLKGEKSDVWHKSYGGGIILSPFNRISVSAAYAISKDDHNIHVRLIRPL